MNIKNPILIAAIAAVLASFAFYHFVLTPKREEADAAKAEVTEAQDKLDAARILLASNQNAREGFRKAYSTVVRLGKAVPGDDDVRSLIIQLDQAAKKTRVDFQSIQAGEAVGASTSTANSTAQLPPGVTIGPAGFPVMPFSFTFRGGFFRLGKFFERLDAFVKASDKRIGVTGRLLTIEGVKLEPDTTGFPNIRATVAATSYLVAPLEGATGGATAAGPADAAGSTVDSTTSTSGPATTTATSTGAFR